MWYLIVFVVLNGNPVLDMFPMDDKEQCEVVAKQFAEKLVKDKNLGVLRCKFINYT